ncbi:hypothetical protein ACJX0J_013395, partial [Zea mays]
MSIKSKKKEGVHIELTFSKKQIADRKHLEHTRANMKSKVDIHFFFFLGAFQISGLAFSAYV